MEKDALDAPTRDALGISDDFNAREIQAGLFVIAVALILP